MKLEHPEKQVNTKELLPQIVDRIFSICKNDSNFELKDELEIVENKIKSLQQKISKQENLLIQSYELKNDLQQRLEILENDNSKKQIELLELLGSD